ncbi:MAG: hypothetical protein M3O70_08975 [Actinomycetota bacterium]|nr:hypothetical protein [Actinomycetota bacterium]
MRGFLQAVGVFTLGAWALVLLVVGFAAVRDAVRDRREQRDMREWERLVTALKAEGPIDWSDA